MTETAPDATHDPARRSWVPGADGHADFPIQNLPLGIFSPPGGAPRGGVAIGDQVLDLPAALAAGLFAGEAARAAGAASAKTLNSFFALGAGPRRALRVRLSEILSLGSDDRARAEPCLRPAADCTLHLPAQVGDYTDFYVGIHHATNIGKVFRPDNPLLPNYKYVPIGYHGRASSLRVSGTGIRRPKGQLKAPEAEAPRFAPCERLDYELELGIWVGPGNELGEPVPVGEAASHVAGYCLLNDWSARDIQAWEYQPLGPFLAKNFGSTLSPWVVTPEALAPFRIAQPPRPEGDPAPLPYLLDEADQRAGAFDLELEVLLATARMREQGLPPHRVSLSNTRHMYWTVAQMIAHHTSNGCNLQPGDLLGSGTISAPDPTGFGSLLETTRGGREPLVLPSGESRRFLEDGDEVTLRLRARRDGAAPIGFGECRATILPAR
ncbi:Fumarylacetoacetase [Roseomonas mucosa]|uniref:fumarylacetoacetase n=1 Tax=Roseomonas mucosa TaxID=207340 RepID=A0A1S8D2N3_9PROT|nr:MULTISPECIES: fumarylacetoacetase [Roseomonas]MBS5903980.1 fumarylacetoacetase [Acetobacteraceae bacterium]ATR21321.1 fumarylacetoacetase [Roseomonas sp. FDAARGOS_362]MCG7352252.1 fumarylacetoacetase [Roseomonas mucosa]MCG7357625.1 fumarylacetoacetase [Roseomonas mucosa]MDT8291493.1 fumarylacetoacetase [Roseomonas mucosa]